MVFFVLGKKVPGMEVPGKSLWKKVLQQKSPAIEFLRKQSCENLLE